MTCQICHLEIYISNQVVYKLSSEIVYLGVGCAESGHNVHPHHSVECLYKTGVSHNLQTVLKDNNLMPPIIKSNS